MDLRPLSEQMISCRGVKCRECPFCNTPECGPMGFIANPKFDNKVTYGFWGADAQTYAYNSGIYQVIVDTETGCPKDGDEYRIGIYLQGTVAAIDVQTRKCFNLSNFEAEAKAFIEEVVCRK